jgi:hypothetical protein
MSSTAGNGMSVIEPSVGHYERLRDERVDDHPVDQIVLSFPDVAEIDRAARAAARALGARVGRIDQELWMKYEDLRLAQRALHEERFFDVGFELGRLAGVAAGHEMAGLREVHDLRLHLEQAVIRTRVNRDQALWALLDVTRALVLGPLGGREGEGR